MAHLLGIDIGTSATKALIIDDRGSVVASAESRHALSMPRPGWSEQDPHWWWDAMCDAVKRALREPGVIADGIAGIGLSGQMHGSVFLARDPTPQDPRVVRPAILWNDQRTAEECAEIESRAGGRASLIRATGNPALTGFTAPKMLWLKNHEPDAYAQVAHVLLPKDFIAFRLTGQLVTDVGDASGTLLFNPAKRAWHDDLIESIRLDRSHLPDTVESCEVIGRVGSFAGEATGLREGTRVVIGSGDQMAGAAGAGIVRPGLVSATLGTSGVVFAHAGEGMPRDESGRVQVMCAAVPGEYCVYGCMLSAAGALNWYRDTFAPDTMFEALDQEASTIGIGAEGLLFLPHLTGERCPHPDPKARGAFIGLTARHGRSHCTRAVLEGVAMTMGQMLDLFGSLGVRPREVRMGGGGAKSALWREIHAAVFGAPAVLLNTAEGSAYGAALLAGVGVGVWESVPAACGACLKEASRIEPDAESVAAYARVKDVFNSLYPILRESFSALDAIGGQED